MPRTFALLRSGNDAGSFLLMRADETQEREQSRYSSILGELHVALLGMHLACDSCREDDLERG